MKTRVKIIIYFVLSVSLLLLSRIYFLSVKSNHHYEELAKKNYIKRFYTTSIRGVIKDRNGKYLAVNNLGFSISFKPHMRNSKNIKEIIKLCKTIQQYLPNLKWEKLLETYKKYDSSYLHTYVEIVEWVAYDKFFKFYAILNANKYIDIKIASKRYYPYKEIAGHIIGYVHKTSRYDIKKDKISKYYNKKGKRGLEQFYNDKLRGSLGFRDVKVNSLYEEVDIINELKPSINNDITTTIDIQLQQYIHKLMDKKAGTIIVMNVNNGEVLSAGSFPEFDNNLFVNGISKKLWNNMRNDIDHPFANKLTRGLYPPGSVIKMGVALSFLDFDSNEKNFKTNCDGAIKLGKRNFRCWKHKGHKKTTMKKAIRESCDVFFYKGSLKVGIKNIHNTLDIFGLGKKTGIDLPKEHYGRNPSKNWKKQSIKTSWVKGDTVNASIGQGFVLVTPMQIARYTSALATSVLTTPHFLKDDSLIKNKILNIPQKDLQTIRKGMFDVCNTAGGTATKHINTKIVIAGKTGTAQVIAIRKNKKRLKEHELKYMNRSHAWLTTYGPYKNPKYSITLLIEHGGHGGSAGGEIVSKIYNKMYYLGYFD